MTNEEFEKKMEFILEQQAQFTVDIQQLRESQAQTEQLVNRLAVVSFDRFKGIDEKIDALVDSQMRLTESQARTDESLRNLMAVVDRSFSEGRNDRSDEKN